MGELRGLKQMNIRLYGTMTTFGLVLNVGMQAMWAFTQMEIFDCIAWAVVLAAVASGAFIILTEPKKKRKAEWMTGRNGLNVLVQRTGRQ